MENNKIIINNNQAGSAALVAGLGFLGEQRVEGRGSGNKR